MSWNGNTAAGDPAFGDGVPGQFEKGQARGFDTGGFNDNGDAGGSDDRACFNCGKTGWVTPPPQHYLVSLTTGSVD